MGWSLKSLHRLLVLSNTYRMASTESPLGSKLDPDNRLVHRMNRRRLDFEQLRDTMLAASGKLDLTVGGHAVDMLSGKEGNRRTLYGFIDRQNLPSLFRTFDFADPNQHSPSRHNTTVPQQALFLLNSGFVQKTARAIVERPGIGELKSPEERIRQMYRVLFARTPMPDELSLGLAFVKGQNAPAAAPLVEAPAWQYGYGEFDPAARRLKAFAPLPHFTGSTWQGGPALPDPKIGWVLIGASNGHPGNDLQHSAVRRWTAPADMTLAVTGRISHPTNQGDGVRALVVSSRLGLLGSWEAFNSSADTAVAQVEVKRGDTLDFVVECRTNPGFDGFSWAPALQAQNPAPGLAQTAWDAAAEFSGPVSPTTIQPLTAWETYAQALLLANEFHFID